LLFKTTDNVYHRGSIFNIIFQFATLLSVQLIAQINTTDPFLQYGQFFDLPREKIFLDLPKDKFYKNEPIRFAGYVLDGKTLLPSVKTSNVYCTIYDSIGHLLEKKLFYTENGKFNGTLEIPATMGAGTYYIKAQTNWMQNFSAKSAYVQDIYVIDSISIARVAEPTTSPDEIVFYPEGGNLIAEVPNSIGFRYISNGKKHRKVKSCQLVNDLGLPILEGINVNAQGYGKFILTPEKNANRVLKMTLSDGKELLKKVPDPNEGGLAIMLNGLTKDFINIRFNLKNDLKNKKTPIFIALHRDGNIKILEYRLTKEQSTLIIHKDEAWPGLNKLSVFNEEYDLLAERIFFNDNGLGFLNHDLSLSNIRKSHDSINIQLALGPSTNPQLAMLSLSILPIESKGHNYNRSLLSWFYLQSYFDQSIRAPFTINTPLERSRLYDLDLFLLNNDWKADNWSDIKKIPETTFAFETGIRIDGKISGDRNIIGKKLIAYQKSIGQYHATTILDESKFVFNDLYLVEGEPIVFFVEDYQFAKSAKIHLSFYPQNQADYLPYSERTSPDAFAEIEQESLYVSKPVQLPGRTILDEVLISGTNKPDLNRNQSLTVGVYEGVKMSEDEASKSIRLSNYLRKLGFKIRLIPQIGMLGVYGRNVTDKPPIVYVDGVKTDNYVEDFLLNSVDEIYYEHFGLEGSDGGTLYIYRSYGQKNNSDTLLQKIAEVGFQTDRFIEDYRHSSFAVNSFLDYASVFWDGAIQLTSDSTYTVRFPHFGLKEFIIYINGMTDQGQLISLTEVIRVDD